MVYPADSDIQSSNNRDQYKACNITEFVLKLEQKLLIECRLKKKIFCVKMFLPFNTSFKWSRFFVMRISIYHTSEQYFSRALLASSEVINQVLSTSTSVNNC